MRIRGSEVSRASNLFRSGYLPSGYRVHNAVTGEERCTLVKVGRGPRTRWPPFGLIRNVSGESDSEDQRPSFPPLLLFPTHGPGFEPAKKKHAEAPEAVTSPKAFLAVKGQTIYATISKQDVKVPVRRETGRTPTKQHLHPGPPHAARSWSADAKHCDLRSALCHFRCLLGRSR